MILENVLNAASVSFSVPKGVSGRIKKVILKLIYITARGVVFVPRSAGQK